MNLPRQTGFFGHPAGLRTLFFVELWERFSYYGMRALLILFMTAPIVSGGLGMPASEAGPIYGMYTAMAYRTRTFWQDPVDMRRARERAVPTGIFTWP